MFLSMERVSIRECLDVVLYAFGRAAGLWVSRHEHCLDGPLAAPKLCPAILELPRLMLIGELAPATL